MTKTEIKEMAQDILLDGMTAHAGYVFEGERAEGLTEEEMVLITQVMKVVMQILIVPTEI